MLGLSERQYAARIGMSRGAVQKAKAAGRLVLHPDGSIDSQASDRRRSQSTDPAKSRSKAAGSRSAAMKPVTEAAVSAVGDTLKEQGMATPAQQLAAPPPMAVRAMKRTLNATAASDLHRALQLETEATVAGFLDPETTSRLNAFERCRSRASWTTVSGRTSQVLFGTTQKPALAGAGAGDSLNCSASVPTHR